MYPAYVMCHVSHVASHLSPVKKPTATATNTPPANSHIMHNKLVCKGPLKWQNPQMSRGILILAKGRGLLQWHKHTLRQLTDIRT